MTNGSTTNKVDQASNQIHCNERGHTWIGNGERNEIEYEKCAFCGIERQTPECALNLTTGTHKFGFPLILRPIAVDRYYTENGADIETIEICEYCGEERNAKNN